MQFISHHNYELSIDETLLAVYVPRIVLQMLVVQTTNDEEYKKKRQTGIVY